VYNLFGTEGYGAAAKKDGDVGGETGVLPVPSGKPGDSAMVDTSNQRISKGILGYLRKFILPLYARMTPAIGWALNNILGLDFPCTLWSLAPLKIDCKKLKD
jgi:hypothetical protein